VNFIGSAGYAVVALLWWAASFRQLFGGLAGSALSHHYLNYYPPTTKTPPHFLPLRKIYPKGTPLGTFTQAALVLLWRGLLPNYSMVYELLEIVIWVKMYTVDDHFSIFFDLRA
jgi:hypothetical protein